jgi:hypothetical protein
MSDDCATVYTSLRLDYNSQEIRLIRLVPDKLPWIPNFSSSRLVSCEFLSFPLNSCPQYKALSYRWGDSSNAKEIKVNGTRFAVRDNLWHFLNEASRRNETQYLWIDALCIDQSNIRERNHQTRLMHLIYNKASLTRVKGETEMG